MCGGDSWPVSPLCVAQGPSPRVRGRPHRWTGSKRSRGSIPACAGETRSGPLLPWDARVHPRVCGGDLAKTLTGTQKSGPSPRVRGRPRPIDCRARRGGSIPACAGETLSGTLNAVTSRVHPRVCGGDRSSVCSSVLAQGPSPRVRGRLHTGTRPRRRRGSIPACAGETGHDNKSPSPDRVHPRVCGGDSTAGLWSALGGGPSPRVRGRLKSMLFVEFAIRSIPACAGETLRQSSLNFHPRVHPRVCGGDSSAASFHGPMKGPSPRVRGRHCGARVYAVPLGSIPACAGETRTNGVMRAFRRVHPRVCGGDALRLSASASDGGPSPRVRGRRKLGIALGALQGSIPACAGETAPNTAAVTAGKVHPRVCGGDISPSPHQPSI